MLSLQTMSLNIMVIFSLPVIVRIISIQSKHVCLIHARIVHRWIVNRWIVYRELALHEKCPYSEFFWSVFSRILTECGKILRTPYLSVFSQNAEKYGPEKLRIRTLFT